MNRGAVLEARSHGYEFPPPPTVQGSEIIEGMEADLNEIQFDPSLFIICQVRCPCP